MRKPRIGRVCVWSDLTSSGKIFPHATGSTFTLPPPPRPALTLADALPWASVLGHAAGHVGELTRAPTPAGSLSAVVSREKDRDPPAGKGLWGELARSGQLPGWWIRSDASTAMIFSDEVFQISRVGDCSEQSTRKLPSPELLLRLTPAFRKNVVSVSESASVSQESTAAPEPLSAVTMYRVHFQSKSPSAVSGSLVMASMAGTSRIPFASTL